jgi:hypothetical protein
MGLATQGGVFGIGFFIGSALFKPVIDLLAAIESRRKARIELQRTTSDAHEHLKTISYVNESRGLVTLRARSPLVGVSPDR